MNSFSTSIKQFKPEAPNVRKLSVLLLFIFLYSTLSGAIRKWVITSETFGNILLAVQLVIPFSLIFIKNLRTPFTNFFTGYVILLVVLAINPMNETIYHGLFGILIHLGFWFAMFYYLRNRDSFNLDPFLKIFILFAIGELILAFIQYSLPPTHFLNKYALEKIKSTAFIGDSVRVTGTFSYLSGFQAFFLFYPMLIWVLMKKGYALYLTIFLYMLGMFGCFMSGSRGALFIYITFGALILLTETNVKRLGATIAVVLFIILASIGINYFLSTKVSGVSEQLGKAYVNFEKRRAQSAKTGEQTRRILGPMEEIIFYKGDYKLIGIGLGATYQGATSVWGTSRYALEYPGGYEEELERIVIEGGFILFIFKIALFLAVFRQLSIPTIAKVVFGLIIFVYVPIVFNIYNSIFLFLGLIMVDKVFYDLKHEPQ